MRVRLIETLECANGSFIHAAAPHGKCSTIRGLVIHARLLVPGNGLDLLKLDNCNLHDRLTLMEVRHVNC